MFSLMWKNEKGQIGKQVYALKEHRRARLDIMADILKTCRDGARKTNVMYHCNLSFQQLKKYLALLVQKDLLRSVFARKDSSVNLFKITDKGTKFLETYRSLKGFLTA